MINLVVASRNRHKIQEIRQLLGESFRCISLDRFPDAPDLTEHGDSLAANATQKAVQLARWLGRARNDLPEIALQKPNLLVLADDSGLEVDALAGAPGVHSARFAGLETGTRGNSSDADNNAKLLRLLEDVPSEKRGARFRCVLALTPVLEATASSSSPVCSADEFELRTELFEGVCDGRIEVVPRGNAGFGYDPLFVPSGYHQSFAELGDEVKNRLSHRAKALAKLRERLTGS